MSTAAEELQHLLYVFAAAQREDGAALDALSRALDAPVEDVLRLIQKATARAFYLPAGAGDALQIMVEADRVRVFAGQGANRDFHRPIRLSQGEALALGLGLRAMASEATPADRPEILALAQRLEQALTAPVDLTVREEPAGARHEGPREPRIEYTGRRATEPPVRLTFEPGRPVELGVGDDGFRSVLSDAARERMKVRLRYVKPGDREPQERLVSPYRIVYAQGAWYVVGHDASRDAVRIFRMDRVLEAEATAERFEVPSDFDIAAFLDEHGRAYRGEGRETWVRYSPRIARWIVERYGCPLESDGSARVRHVVADDRWIVRHVMRYGGEAVVEART